ncbi:proline--tRNA ligase [Thermoactinomyces intermedius]|uniref:Proline--tRNA ligase n=1 Tax=Thermoactinomyces intermedius TaxID=2024 RepID=A0A8I1A2K7_THEIN|nr:proline--tRNA ligase [Thermoactinomyces intermedius]MBA4547410.1 proline--tRNA ligase [Thermoactinomyces intermedius]MBA4837656.1 proline--tRNA ligase [Thermoactinomyces intermedius]MBH8594362.1 proline--tRNA ligase [Thermoactinomyces intermedius]
MRQNNMMAPTLRTVGEAEMISHQLLLRGGFIRQLAAGIYTFLPLGYRVLHKVEQIVREEMDRIGGQELLLPTLHPAELWQESGRWDTYGPDLFKMQDRHDRPFAIGPTHEEVITDLLRGEINSYKKLPMILYQIQNKFRDEKRPRSGLLRGREFIMKDAYSFHSDRDSLNETYEKMYQAYQNIFTRIGLEFRAVEADSGSIGGKGTHEFMALADAGEDTVVICESCDYSANVEMAEVAGEENTSGVASVEKMEKVHTPQKRTIEEVAKYLDVPVSKLAKSLVFLVDGEPVLVLVRGDHEVNDVKVKNLLNATVCELADDQTVQEIAGAPAGFVGPVGLKKKVKVLADQAVMNQRELIVGANEVDHHFIHVQPGRDFGVDVTGDLRNIQEGDRCPRCGGVISLRRGIEVGHVFKLGTRYSVAMKAGFLDENGKEQPFIMGCYGIGISRAVASVVEQNHDEYGIIWPVSIAPYTVHLIAVNMKNEVQAKTAEKLYQELLEAGYEVLFDDRKERAGVKFKDADLFGIPVRITVGAKAGDGLVEMKLRRSGDAQDVAVENVIRDLPEWIKRADNPS